MTTRICSVNGCEKPGRNAGLCHKHYARLRRHGDVRTNKHNEALRWLRAHSNHQDDECLIFPFQRNAHGYGVIRDPFKKRGSALASRVMAKISLGEPPSKDHYACHKCHNGASGCVNPKHLYWGTNRENQMDRVAAGNSNRGSRHGCAKLTESDVREIRRLKEHGARIPEIASQFGISVSGAYGIVNRSTWSWLDK